MSRVTHPSRSCWRDVAGALDAAESQQEFYGDESNDGGIGFEFREEEAGEGSWRIEELRSWTEGLKLKLVCEQRGDELRTEWWYDEQRYEREQIEFLSEGLEATLASASGESASRGTGDPGAE